MSSQILLQDVVGASFRPRLMAAGTKGPDAETATGGFDFARKGENQGN